MLFAIDAAVGATAPVPEGSGVDRLAFTPRHLTHNVHNPYAGPLSRRLWEKAHSITSQYPDTFDYGI